MRGEIVDFARLEARDRLAQTVRVVQRYAGTDRAVGLLESLTPKSIDGMPIAQQLLAQEAAVLPLWPTIRMMVPTAQIRATADFELLTPVSKFSSSGLRRNWLDEVVVVADDLVNLILQARQQGFVIFERRSKIVLQQRLELE